MKLCTLLGGVVLLMLILVPCYLAAPVPAPESPKLRATLKGHEKIVCRLAFSHDGKLLASGGRDGTVKLWNVTETKEIFTLKGHTGVISGLAFSPDSKILASGDQFCINLWNVAENKTDPITTINRYSSDLLFSLDGKSLVSVRDGVDMWDMQNKELQGTKLPKLAITLNSLVYTPEGKLLAAARPVDKTVSLYDVVEEKKIATIELPPEHDAVRVAFSPDGKIFVTGTYHEGTIRLWDVAMGKPKTTIKVGDQVCCAFAFNPKGTILATGLRDRINTRVGTIALYEVATGKELAVLKGIEGAPYDLVFSPDGKTLASCAGFESTIRLWSIPEVIKAEK